MCNILNHIHHVGADYKKCNLSPVEHVIKKHVELVLPVEHVLCVENVLPVEHVICVEHNATCG